MTARALGLPLIVATVVVCSIQAPHGVAQDGGVSFGNSSVGALMAAFTADTDLEPLTSFTQIAALWPCALPDEFEQRRCEEQRPTQLRHLQRQTFVGFTVGQVGAYDFRRQRFEVDVLRGVVMTDVPDGFMPLVMRSPAGQEQAWGAVRDGNLADLPPALRLTRVQVPFASSDEAETWRNGRQANVGNPIPVGVLVIFRLGRPWTYRAPPNVLDQYLRREIRRVIGPIPAARGEELRGVDLRPLGYVAIIPGHSIVSARLAGAGAAPTRQLDTAVRVYSERLLAPPARAAADGSSTAASRPEDPPAAIDELLLDHALAPSTPSDLPDTPPRSVVSSALGGRAAAVRACANGTSGTATVTVTFGSDGRVSSAEVVDGPFAGNSCISDAVRAADVPPFRQTAFRVNFPYRL